MLMAQVLLWTFSSKTVSNWFKIKKKRNWKYSKKYYNNFCSKKGADLQQLYTQFKNISNLDVYKKQDIPESLFYKHNDRIGEIVIVSKLGSVVFKNETPYTYCKLKSTSSQCDISLILFFLLLKMALMAGTTTSRACIPYS